MKATFKHRVTVTLTVQQYNALTRRAHDQGNSLAVVIREVLSIGIRRAVSQSLSQTQPQRKP